MDFLGYVGTFGGIKIILVEAEEPAEGVLAMGATPFFTSTILGFSWLLCPSKGVRGGAEGLEETVDLAT